MTVYMPRFMVENCGFRLILASGTPSGLGGRIWGHPSYLNRSRWVTLDSSGIPENGCFLELWHVRVVTWIELRWPQRSSPSLAFGWTFIRVIGSLSICSNCLLKLFDETIIRIPFDWFLWSFGRCSWLTFSGYAQELWLACSGTNGFSKNISGFDDTIIRNSFQLFLELGSMALTPLHDRSVTFGLIVISGH